MRAGYVVAVLLCMTNVLRMVRRRCIDVQRGYDDRCSLSKAKLLLKCRIPCIAVYFAVTKVIDWPKDKPIQVLTRPVGMLLYVPSKLYTAHYFDLLSMVSDVSEETFMRELGWRYCLSLTLEIPTRDVNKVADEMGESRKKFRNCMIECKRNLYLKMYQKGYIPKAAFVGM